MKFTPTNIQALASSLDKMQRFFAYKYEVPKSNVAFVIKGHNINVMINGKMKESFIPASLAICKINEETLEIVNKKT